jgi:aldose 1-epimerase
MAISGMRYDLVSGDYLASVSEVGAGLAGLWRGERLITADYGTDVLPPMSCGAVLVPWPNRIRDGHYSFDGVEHQLPLSEPANHNASHGLARWERWAIEDQTESSVTLALDIVPQTGFEFELRCQLRYALDADGLTVTVSATNLGSRTAPFGAGFHPYFDLNSHDIDHAEIEIPARSMLVTDDRQIPTGSQDVEGTPYDLRTLRPVGTLRVDHAFSDLTGSRAIVAVGGHRSEIWWDEAFHYLQVFTPPVQRFGRTAIAIEPMTCPANAYNSGDGLLRLEPGQSWSANWGITATK